MVKYMNREIEILDNGLLKDKEFGDKWRLYRVQRCYLKRDKTLWKTFAEPIYRKKWTEVKNEA